MKKIYNMMAVLALVTGLAASCQKAPEVPQDRKIRFSMEAPEVSLETKATVVTTTTINTNGFNVSATTGSAGSESSAWNSVAFTKNGTYFESSKLWPSTDPSYHFYASNNAITFAAAGSTVSASNSTDVVCAYIASPTYESPNSLTFKHIFARIGNFTVTAVDGYTITNVHAKITPKVSGTYNIRTGNGQTNGTGWSSTSNGSQTELANTTPGTKSNDLYLVPGNYDIAFTWTASKDDYTANLSKTVTGVSIVGGKVNTITAGLTGDAETIQFTATVTEWGDPVNVAIGTVTPD